MKWVTFISCLLLISFAESKHLPRRYRDVAHHDTLSRVSDLDPLELHVVAVILFAQTAQKATNEEVQHLAQDISALAQKCAADAQSDPQCSQPLPTVFLNELCHEDGFAAKYGFTDCCAKTDPERNDCVLAHKNTTPGFIPPFQKPPAEEACRAYAENRPKVLQTYACEIARRAPTAKVSSITYADYEYDEILKFCCQQADKDACFHEKAPAVKKRLLKSIALQNHACSILKKFNKKPLQAVKITQLSQKFPRAPLSVITKLTEDIVHVHEECCKGDSLACLLDRDHLAEYICTHQDTISSKVKGCCEKHRLERANCLVDVEPDDKPEGLSESIKEEFVTDKDVCKHYTEDKLLHLAKFLNEYGKRHPEQSTLSIVRFGKGYEDLLEKCCPHEPAAECLEQGVGEAKKHIAEIQEVVKTKCDIYGKLGRYLFHNEVLVDYTKKAPQLPFEELHDYSKHFTEVAETCCKLDDAHRLQCAETYTAVVLGNICQRHEEHHINKQICKCCGDSYAFRRECFSHLGPDPEYKPPPFSPEIFAFHSDLCSAQGEDLEKKKQKQLVNLIKQKPGITEEELASAIVDFTTLVAQCCAAENHDECFATEGGKVIEKVRNDLGVH